MDPVLLAATVLLVLAPQSGLARTVPDKSTIVVDPAYHRVDRVVVKFAEGSAAQWRDGALTSAVVDLAPVRAAIGARDVQPFFAGAETALGEIRARVRARLAPGANAPADLALYFEVATTDLADARTVVKALNDQAAVELAYPRERPVPPPGDVPPLTPSFVGQQSYRSAAPNGIDARAMRQLVGGWGRGVTLVDIEWNWYFDHEDLAALRPNALLGPPPSVAAFQDHGTAVIGELAADPDQFGVSGFVPDVTLRVATDYPGSGYSVANAIVAALPSLRAHDVLLLEAQATTSTGVLVPTEYVQADFDAIQNATALGVITIEAAGNGNADLDSPQFAGRFNLNVRDSGALIVGATLGVTPVRGGGSCYGSRVDANGWGEFVTTTGYGDLFSGVGTHEQYYTSAFNGTSSASPMVAAAVVAILGAAAAQLDSITAAAIDYRTLRAWLRAHGTALSPNQGIGLRPDLDKLLRVGRLQRGLRVLDDVRLGRAFRLEITAPFAATAADPWALLAAVQTTNVPVVLPSADPLCKRWLLHPATTVSLLAGPFAANPVVLTLPVPNDASLVHARIYLQVLNAQLGVPNACLTNSAMLFVEP